MINGLTVDLEDWYHICGVEGYSDPQKWDTYENRIIRNTDKVLALLRTYKVKATFFCPWIHCFQRTWSYKDDQGRGA